MREAPCNLWTMISDKYSLSNDSTEETEDDSMDELRRYSRIDNVMRLLITGKLESRRYTSHIAQKPDTHLISYMSQETDETVKQARASFRMFSFIKAWSKAYEHLDRLTPLTYIRLKNKLEKWFRESNLKRRVLRRSQIVYNPGVMDIVPENRLKFKRIWERIQKEYGVKRLILNNIIKQSELANRMQEKQKAQFQSVAKTLAAKERQHIISMKQSGFISQKELQFYLDYLKNKTRQSETEASVPKPEIIRKSEKIPFVETSSPEKFSIEPLRRFMVRRLKELITTSPEIKENIPETFFHDALSTDVCRLSQESFDSYTHEQLDWFKKNSHIEDEEFDDIGSELFRQFGRYSKTSSTGTFRDESISIFDEGNPDRYTIMQLFKAAESILKPRKSQQ
ncbi:hypothetical protein T265_08868 [Opisthorchis viverrini]|uniref:Uncharacterized protein n=1 Tax=Opisthorchis viverrini TaxID=6198 RepID=A0A074ZIR4_OPIVI|nr:hypothetical protein T265_08868 [Opisthorchis viverrini]KER23220.1 hypothetical protein T265_08868 [Opisthorchis viverrini]